MSPDAVVPAEQRARALIDAQLSAAGWAVQSRGSLNLYAGQGVAVREAVMAPGHGRTDYLLYVDQPLKQNPLRRQHLDDFVTSYAPGRVRSEARDKSNLDITWRKDDSLEDLENLPATVIIAREIVEDLTAALAEFEAAAAAFQVRNRESALAVSYESA